MSNPFRRAYEIGYVLVLASAMVHAQSRNPAHVAADAMAATIRASLGQPAPPPPRPVPIRCPECRHLTLRHTSAPGRGCEHAGCLCLDTPQLILAEAVTG